LFLELTSKATGKKYLQNADYIVGVGDVDGVCKISCVRCDKWIHVPVCETYDEVKAMLWGMDD